MPRVIVKVEACSGGRETYQRLTVPDQYGQSSRETIRSESWDRKAATEALNLLSSVYGIPRRDVRFDVH